MVKLVQNTVSPDGFPHVRWDQQVPSGESLHGAEQWMALKIAVVVMIFVFTAVYAARDRKSTRLNSSHIQKSRMPSSA